MTAIEPPIRLRYDNRSEFERSTRLLDDMGFEYTSSVAIEPNPFDDRPSRVWFVELTDPSVHVVTYPDLDARLTHVDRVRAWFLAAFLTLVVCAFAAVVFVGFVALLGRL